MHRYSFIIAPNDTKSEQQEMDRGMTWGVNIIVQTQLNEDYGDLTQETGIAKRNGECIDGNTSGPDFKNGPRMDFDFDF